MTALWLANTSDKANAVSVLEAEAKSATISKHGSYLEAAFHNTSPDRICWIINIPNVWWQVSSTGHYMFNGYIWFFFYWGFNQPVVSHIKSHIWRQHNLIWLTLWLDFKKHMWKLSGLSCKLNFAQSSCNEAESQKWGPDVVLTKTSVYTKQSANIHLG